MKNYYIGFIAFLCVGFSYAQVGIGTVTPDPSSILDISATDKGILIPRVDLGDPSTSNVITNPVKSLMVWNTDAANDGANEGFYFYTGSDWNVLNNDECEAGSLSGEEIKRYAEIYKTAASSALDQNNPIEFGVTAFAEGINANSNSFEAVIAGVYRVSYTVTVQKTSGGNSNPKFYLGIGGNTNIVPGSSTFTTLSNGQVLTVSATKLVQLDASEQLYLYSDTSDNNIRVMPHGTNFTIELVKED
ncbi:MAG: hypothetical protein WD554_03570 [Flavobacteriaceae bacterium]